MMGLARRLTKVKAEPPANCDYSVSAFLGVGYGQRGVDWDARCVEWRAAPAGPAFATYR